MTSPSDDLPEGRHDALETGFELLISNLLRFGVRLSLALVTLGLIVVFVRHPQYLSEGGAVLEELLHPERLRAVRSAAAPAGLAEITRFHEFPLIMAGLALLIATPIARVIVSLSLFVRRREITFVFVTSLVLLLLLISFLTGGAH